MPIAIPDYPALRRVLDACPAVDEYAAYYRQFEVPHRRSGDLVPHTRDLLAAVLRPDARVLDIGCGRGDTLLDLAGRFVHGDGVDESADVMIAGAEAEQARRGVSNVAFHAAKAVALPFADGTFDVVFSERGPLGHQDVTLREALRVLRPGGAMVLELVGEWNSWQTRAAFEPGYERPPSPLARLEIERDRLARHGVDVATAASQCQRLEFDTVEHWLRFQVYTWSPPGREAFGPDSIDAIRRFVDLAQTPRGTLAITAHTLLLSGTNTGIAEPCPEREALP